MKCRGVQRRIHQWLDQEISQAHKTDLEAHIRVCAACQRHAESSRQLQALLRAKQELLQPSDGFEETFWKKVSETRKEPWIYQVLQNLEGTLTFPSFSQVFAGVLIGLVLGGSGGVLATFFAQASQGRDVNRASLQNLSGFHEVSGLPAPSLAVAYLRTIENNSPV